MLSVERPFQDIDNQTAISQIHRAISIYLTHQEKAIGLLANALAPEVASFEDIDLNSKNGDKELPTPQPATKSISRVMASARSHIFENIQPYETPTSAQVMQAFKLYQQTKDLLADLACNKRVLRNSDISIIRTGIRARQFLILANMKLVAFFSGRYSKDNYYFEDTLQEGMLGLIATVEKFNYGKDIELSTYAAYWIRRNMARLNDEDSLIRIPLYLTVAINMHKKQETLGQDESHVSESRVALMKHAQIIKNTKDLDETVSEDLKLEEVLPDKYDFLEVLSNEWSEEDLQDLFEEVLDSKEELVLKLCYGIGIDHKLSQKEIARKMGYTTQRVQQISLTARKKIKHYFSKQGINSYRQSFDVI